MLVAVLHLDIVTPHSRFAWRSMIWPIPTDPPVGAACRGGAQPRGIRYGHASRNRLTPGSLRVSSHVPVGNFRMGSLVTLITK